MPVDPQVLRARALTVEGVSPDVAALTCALVYVGDQFGRVAEAMANPARSTPGHAGPMSPCAEAVAAAAQREHSRKTR